MQPSRMTLYTGGEAPQLKAYWVLNKFNSRRAYGT
nr:MAG TPA: hypothetical protein [Caudoviricetes sp.]